MRLGISFFCAILIAACGRSEVEETVERAASAEPASAVEVKPEKGATETQPNFLIVVADDLGWSDIGAFGGEIKTPTLDALAARGMMMTSFYVAPTCSPTRSMLMTGTDNHAAGVGAMSGIQAPNQTTRNYAAQLHGDVVTIAEALKPHGYQTLMSGKWHLAVDETQYPNRRGFDRSFALLPGGGSHFADRKSISPTEIPEYIEDGEPVEKLPGDFYSSISYTDKMLDYLKSRDTDKPFMAYLAYTAPHDPLQVPDEWLDRYDGAYDSGPYVTRQARVKRLQKKGLVKDNIELWQAPNFPDWLPMHAAPWKTRSEDQREIDTRPMEIYASMVELMDQQLGR
ncbi:MAG: sulfatase-like hydrolase/transferase, partial [Pseudomonadota bacterium]